MGQLEQANERIQAALKLLDTDAADAIIGEPGDEHAALVRGVEATVQLLWAGMQQCGAKKDQRSLGYVAKTMVILLQLVHFAYALGVQRGRAEAEAQGAK